MKPSWPSAPTSLNGWPSSAGPSSTNSNFNDARAAGASGKSSYYATAFSDVIEHSGAPRGSTYYHFPGGKRDLAREAIAAAGDEREEMVAKAAERANHPASLVRALGEVEAQRLDHSAYQRGCAIATMVLELAPDDEELSTDFDNAFARWRAALVARFEPWGIAPERAVVLADLVMSVIEGSLLLSRAAQSTEPLRTSVDALAQVIENETTGAPAGPSPGRPPRRRPHTNGKTPPLC